MLEQQQILLFLQGEQAGGDNWCFASEDLGGFNEPAAETSCPSSCLMMAVAPLNTGIYPHWSTNKHLFLNVSLIDAFCNVAAVSILAIVHQFIVGKSCQIIPVQWFHLFSAVAWVTTNTCSLPLPGSMNPSLMRFKKVYSYVKFIQNGFD